MSLVSFIKRLVGKKQQNKAPAQTPPIIPEQGVETKVKESVSEIASDVISDVRAEAADVAKSTLVDNKALILSTATDASVAATPWLVKQASKSLEEKGYGIPDEVTEILVRGVVASLLTELSSAIDNTSK